jgi:hypothetical protein
MYYPDATPPAISTPDTGCGTTLFKLEEPYFDLKLAGPDIKARDASNSEVTVTLRAIDQTKGVNLPYLFKYHQPVVVIGGRVFGLSDAPFISTVYEPKEGEKKRSVSFTFVAPTQLLATSKTALESGRALDRLHAERQVHRDGCDHPRLQRGEDTTGCQRRRFLEGGESAGR